MSDKRGASPCIFGVGQILSNTFSTLFKKPSVFFGLSIIAGLPSALFLIKNRKDMELTWLMGETDFILTGVASILSVIGSMLMEACAVYAVFRVLRKEAVTIEQAYDFSKANMWPLLLATILVGLVIGVGTVFFVIPGIILMLILAMTIPVCAVERCGVIDSIKRSVTLTLGYRLPILCLYLVSGILIAVLGFLSDAILGGLTIGFTSYTAISTLLNAIPLTFELVMTALIYFNLREIKEGMTLDHLADAFELEQGK